MTDQRRENPDDLLDKAIAARRDMETPSGPPPHVLARTIEHLQAAEQSRTFNFNRKVLTMKTLNKLAVAAVILIAVVGLYLGLFRQAPRAMAFADVIQSVTRAECVTYKLSGMAPIPGKPALPVSADVWITRAGERLVDHQQIPQPDGKTKRTDTETVMSWREGKGLTLDPASHQALVMEITNVPAARAKEDLLERFKTLDGNAAKPIGPREVTGHKTQGFQVAVPNLDMTVWSDVETHLPVLIEQTMKKSPIMPAFTVTLSDFDWNAQIDESLMSLTPPAGYTVQTMKMNMAPATEKDLIAGLKAAAELNGGRFPDSLDTNGVAASMGWRMGQTIGKMGRATMKMDSPQWKEMQQKNADAMSVIGRAWLFLGDPRNGQDFHYAGKDVEAGQAGRPVLWYRPAGSSSYHVIDADLSVHEVAPSALPNVPSTLMGPPLTTAPTPAAR